MILNSANQYLFDNTKLDKPNKLGLHRLRTRYQIENIYQKTHSRNILVESRYRYLTIFIPNEFND